MGFFDFITQPVASLAGATIGAVGGLFGNKSSADEAQKSRDQSIEAAKNKHRWEVADLKAAGLNPILSANSGASISSLPSASQGNPFQGIGDTLNSARKIDQVDKEALKIQSFLADSQVGLNHASQSNQYSQSFKNYEEQKLIDAQRGLTSANEYNALLQSQNILEQNNAIRAAMLKDQSQIRVNSAIEEKIRGEKSLIDYDIKSREYGKEVEKYTAPIDRVLDTVGKGTDAVSPKRFLKGKKP